MPDLAAILLLAARVLRVYRERPITASIMTRIMIVYPVELCSCWWWWCRCNMATVNYNTLLSLQSVLSSNLPFLSNQIHSFEQLHCIACQRRIPETALQCSLARDKFV